jgi:GT2 family glycosyltransferase
LLGKDPSTVPHLKMKKNIEVSIIIVSYHSAQAVEKCRKSIGENQKYEIIVIDNTDHNIGFSAACNQGAQQASGKYLFFLNPDTEVANGCIEKLVRKIKSNETYGIVAPQLSTEAGQPYRSYSLQPKWYTFPLLHSFIWEYLPHSLQAHIDTYLNDSLTVEKNVEAASGAALLVEKNIFDKIGGFDTDYFLYWEDYDICKKILNLNMKIRFVPDAKVMHSGGGATVDKKSAHALFQQSRFKFLKKRFGYIYALIVEFFLRSSEAI